MFVHSRSRRQPVAGIVVSWYKMKLIITRATLSYFIVGQRIGDLHNRDAFSLG